jgi:hypothetical protein
MEYGGMVKLHMGTLEREEKRKSTTYIMMMDYRSMRSMEEHIEFAEGEDDSEEDREEVKDNMDILLDNDDNSTYIDISPML